MIDELDSSTAHPSLFQLERRFTNLPSPQAQETKPSRRLFTVGQHLCLTIKNPQTLSDMIDYSNRDPYGMRDLMLT